MIYARWTHRLRTYRLSRGLIQREVARMVGVSRSQYTHIENGGCVINYVQLIRLAKGLHISVAELMDLPSVTPAMLRKTLPNVKKTFKQCG